MRWIGKVAAMPRTARVAVYAGYDVDASGHAVLVHRVLTTDLTEKRPPKNSGENTSHKWSARRVTARGMADF